MCTAGVLQLSTHALGVSTCPAGSWHTGGVLSLMRADVAYFRLTRLHCQSLHTLSNVLSPASCFCCGRHGRPVAVTPFSLESL